MLRLGTRPLLCAATRPRAGLIRRQDRLIALMAICETDIDYGAETRNRVVARTWSQRDRRDSLCPKAIVVNLFVSGPLI